MGLWKDQNGENSVSGIVPRRWEANFMTAWKVIKAPLHPVQAILKLPK